ncbi:MAG: hypothetical protein ACE5Q6_12280 [Dehalococcoidia bacterium]
MSLRRILLAVLIGTGTVAASGLVSTSILSAQEALDTITVRGTVINGTAGAGIAPESPIMFHSFDQIVSPILTIETFTTGDGDFEFKDVKLREGGGYAVVMEYAGIRYSSLLSREDLDSPIELMVYEATSDISVIQVISQALIIADVNEKDREISALEVLNITNTSDRTLLPDLSNITSPTQINFLRFSLPPQATQLDVQSDLLGGDIIPIGTGFAATSPVKPGDHSINLTFRFPYEGNSVSYRDSMLQGAEAYRILIPKELSQVQVAPLEGQPEIDIGGSVYRVWEARDFAPGAALVVELSRLPQPSLWYRLEKSVSDGSFWQVSIPSLLGFALALVLIYAGWKAPKRATAPATPAANGLSETDARRRESLVRAIAALDERFDQDQVPEAEYNSQREQLKQRIQQTPDTPGNP